MKKGWTYVHSTEGVYVSICIFCGTLLLHVIAAVGSEEVSFLPDLGI